MFDFFARRARPDAARVRDVRFLTPHPGVSAVYAWVTIEAQERPLVLSSVDLRADPARRRIVGTTDNVARLSLDVAALEGTGPVAFDLDGARGFATPSRDRVTLHRRHGSWEPGPPASASTKGPHRAGMFKDAFRNRVMFVVGSAGNAVENAWALAKARYDAEQFGYDGNGSIDIVLDEEFDADHERDRNVVLYGNAATNRAWKALLRESPVQVLRGEVRVGPRRFRGGDLAVLLVRPRPGSYLATVGVVAGTGITGMRLCDARPTLSPGFADPDVTILRAPRRGGEDRAAIFAGFFGNDWSVERGEFASP
jgi:hypothetical protein